MIKCSFELVVNMTRGDKYCPSALICKPTPEPQRNCVVLDTKHEKTYLGSDLTVYRPIKSALVTANSCFIEQLET
jgi:hypothetical protein